MDSMDPWRLRVFLQVVEAGGVTAAAEQLAVSQSDVSFHVKQLERELGMSLLARQGRRVVPTDAGLLVAQGAREVLNEVQNLRRAAADFRDGRAGVVRLGASMTIGSYLLPPLVTSFCQAHPDVFVSVSIERTAAVCEAIADGSLDFGYVVVSNIPAHLVTEPVYQDELVLVASPTFRAPLTTPITYEELTRLPFVAAMSGTPYREFVDSWLRRMHVLALNVVAEVGSTAALMLAAATGLGLTYCFRCAVEREVADGRLCIVPVQEIHLSHVFCLVYRKRQRFSPAVSRFLDHLRAHGHPTLAPTRDGG